MKSRIQILFLAFLFSLAGIILRLSYWQLVRGPELSVQARDQYTSKKILFPKRGEIVTSDGYPLVVNRPVYSLTAYIPHLQVSPAKIVDTILPLISIEVDDPALATDSAKLAAKKKELTTELELSMLDKLTSKNYAVLVRSLSVEEKNSLASLALSGLSFEEGFTRGYPESSLSAHLAGFVGRDDLGEPTGYFGLEGYYDRELTVKTGIQKQEKERMTYRPTQAF